MNKNLIVALCLVPGLASAELIEMGSAGLIPKTTSNGHSTNWGHALFSGVVNRPNLYVMKVNKVILRGFTHSMIGQLEVNLVNSAGGFTTLYSSGFTDRTRASGTYELVEDASLKTLGKGATGTGFIPSGQYAPSGVDFDFNPVRSSYSSFVGKQVSGSWNLIFDNYSRDLNGNLQSWAIDVTIQAVPEPATFFALAGLLTITRLRQK